MKVLFAVNNENISESIIKLYQKEYKEIISGKNVYYFNAIIKELQRDQTYDRVVISEDLEPYSNNNLDIVDKFLFEQLDKISDEAINDVGSDIPIIFIATDRRSKSDDLLSKLFSIGVYDALLGSDRSIPEVCKLLNRPRTKKEAKIYYKIETEEVKYHSESEESVSETEIQNILTHYKKLGKNQDRYVESFNNIAAQYNDAQLRIITKFLPIRVKAVLEAESPKYQSIMTFGEGTYNYNNKKQEEKKDNLKIGFIETHSNKGRPTKPVVIPSVVDKNNVKKITSDKVKEENVKSNVVNEIPRNSEQSDMFTDIIKDDEVKQDITEIENVKPVQEEPVRKRRGRPKKQTEEVIQPEEPMSEPEPIYQEEKEETEFVPKRRGRPRRTVESSQNNLTTQNKVEKDLTRFDEPEENTLPGFDEIEENVLPGFDEIEENTLPGFDETEKEQVSFERADNYNYNDGRTSKTEPLENISNSTLNIGLARLLSKDKKVVAFVGTTKCGTSFLINTLADLTAKSGINTAILDATLNRNSYYIYTKNEEPLRKRVANCLEDLEQGIQSGINVEKNLTVFTTIPGKRIEINDIEQVITTLAKEFSLILIDCDFETPIEYFKLAQEIYLVQSMDILTIQPLTAFLRDLQSSGILEPSKLKVVINKAMKVRGLSTNAIIGGMSCYNDPEMSYMRNLFDKDKIPSVSISFNEEALSRYLSGIVDCIVTTNGYPKQFMAELKKLADMVYPLINSKIRTDYTKNNKFAEKNQYDAQMEDNFTRDMNSTLDKMKRQYK